ncbi:hypothetical protein LJ737_06140 [Hymenobacter sp. 15J16-1T3B]|uniref:hypothetical protein n=1 Tax=Hymenobacter sp. 15J16-1T3B TaxID=2886941 RepID=UPI001D12D378|nr:hypothetical protein [Hymenobacter sp. 15J16-1T3B]MCC3156807.1 hypothetical protein [Hymenobacter sp. 15J16-1T3B]
MPHYSVSRLIRCLLLSSLLLPALPAAAQQATAAKAGRWSLSSSLLVGRLRYPAARQRNGSAENGTDYTLGQHPPQVGAAVGATLALPVPPASRSTCFVLSLRAAYNRRQLTVHADPYAPTVPPPPAYDARFRYRTVDAQVGLGVRHYLAPRRRVFWEIGPMLALTCQDYSRLDSEASTKGYLPAPGTNVLLRGAFGLRPAGPASRWQLSAGYARGLVLRRTQVATGEDFAELTVQYALKPQ